MSIRFEKKTSVKYFWRSSRTTSGVFSDFVYFQTSRSGTSKARHRRWERVRNGDGKDGKKKSFKSGHCRFGSSLFGMTGVFIAQFLDGQMLDKFSTLESHAWGQCFLHLNSRGIVGKS